MGKVRVRYAPSPTGVPHIGNIRTALFNFLFAKNQKGDFILRVEDTDQKRFNPDSIRLIQESLDQLGLKWDEYYLQSQRLDLYKTHLLLLKKKNLAYEDKGAWFFKIAENKKISWNDLLHGQIEFSSNVLEDFVIVKSDGFPTYHFASVVDDHQMAISHVIRGDEWISSTPKHLLIYEASSWQPPKFLHLPPILGPNKKKLSKREGAKSTLEYIKEGYLSEALVNFLALLGWSPKGDREIFSLDELTGEFSLDRLNKNSPIFNIEKLNWFNMQWIKKTDDQRLAYLINKEYGKYPLDKLLPLIPLVKERIKKITDFPKLANFLFEPPKVSDIPRTLVSLATIADVSTTFSNSQSWGAASIKSMVEQTARQHQEDRIETIGSIRNIVAGSAVTPPLYESLEHLGKKETVRRLDEYVKKQKK